MSSPAPTDQLINDLQAVIKDAEVLLENSTAPLGEEFKSAKARFENTIENAKQEAARLQKLVVNKAKDAAQSTDNYVKEKPWQAVGLSAAIGLVIGMLICRR